MATRVVCSHCGQKGAIVGADNNKQWFCGYCNTPEKRAEMDKNNKKIFSDNGLPEYHCKFCEKEVKNGKR